MGVGVLSVYISRGVMKGAMKLKIGIFIGVIALLIISLVGYKAIKIFSDIRELKRGIAQGSAIEILKGKADKVASDLHQISTFSGAPGFSRVLGLAGLNGNSIEPEIQSVIAVTPLLLGSDRPKKYLIAFQNSAEARGTGGIIGAFAVVEVNKGKISVIKTGSNEILRWIDEIPIAMPDEFKALYGSDPAIWQNSNLSPHFPYGAKIWLALWKKQFGQSLDGVIAVDPTALSYILKATGPITLPSGKVLTSENLVSETLSRAYKEYEGDNEARKQYLVEIINATFKELLEGSFNKLQMARALQQGVIENRILVYSTEPDVESELATTRLAGAMETTPSNEFRVVVQNTDASKLDYYLDRALSIRSLGCGASAQVEVSVTVKNSLASGLNLPAYVLTRADKGRAKTVVAGQHRFKLFIYGPPNATLLHANRSSTTASAGGVATERGRPILVADIDLPPGGSERVNAVFTRGIGILKYHSQPLVGFEKVKIVDQCQ